jgi:hypothetical protein
MDVILWNGNPKNLALVFDLSETRKKELIDNGAKIINIKPTNSILDLFDKLYPAYNHSLDDLDNKNKY